MDTLIELTAEAEATITEVWTLRVSAEDAKRAIEDKDFALELLDNGPAKIVGVENVGSANEENRRVLYAQEAP